MHQNPRRETAKTMTDNQIPAPQEGSSQPAPAAPATPSPQGGEPQTFDAEYVAGLRRENAKYRVEAKANADKAARLDEIEASKKSELEKLTEDRDTHRRRADAAELNAARNAVALEKGLTISQAKRLVGSTREELAADADELLADLEAGRTKSPKPNQAQAHSTQTPAGSGDWLRDRLTRT